MIFLCCSVHINESAIGGVSGYGWWDTVGRELAHGLPFHSTSVAMDKRGSQCWDKQVILVE